MIEASALSFPTAREDHRPRRGFAVGLAAGVAAVALVGLFVVGQGQLLRIAIPVAAALVGLALYFYFPVRYIEYSLWVWFLAPLVRRLVDFRFGYLEPNMVLLAPLAVSAVAGLTLVLPDSRPKARVPAPFLLCGVAILYGFFVGMFIHPSAETVYGLANWLAPLLVGLHMFLNRSDFEGYRKGISRTFLWGVLVLGVYGIYQYFVAPAWDTYWLTNTQLGSINPSFGEAEPFLIRVWSTLNSPGPFANMMTVGLLLLFANRSLWKIPAAVAGYVSLLLSMVRGAWLSWLIGVVLVVMKMKSRFLIRTVLSMAVIGVCLLPFLSDPRVAPVVGDRISTFADLGHDESFGSRLDMYSSLAKESLHNPFGLGLSNETEWHNTPIDSGVVSVFFCLGWLGAGLFLAGIAALMATAGRSLQDADPFAIVSWAVVVAILSQMLGGNVFVGINGAMFWMFGALIIGRSKDRDEVPESPVEIHGDF